MKRFSAVKKDRLGTPIAAFLREDFEEEIEEDNDRAPTSRPRPCPFIDDEASEDISSLTDAEYEPAPRSRKRKAAKSIGNRNL
jgi:hypothetical protein